MGCFTGKSAVVAKLVESDLATKPVESDLATKPADSDVATKPVETTEPTELTAPRDPAEARTLDALVPLAPVPAANVAAAEERIAEPSLDRVEYRAITLEQLNTLILDEVENRADAEGAFR